MQKLLGNLKRGLLIVISAPSGTGKTTLVSLLKKEFPQEVEESISCTTRPPRSGEVEGRDYFFVNNDVFEEKKKKGELLEHVSLFGFEYGTLKRWVEAIQNKGKHVLLVIDTRGAMQLMRSFSALFIFIIPPSLEVLKKRLKGRKTESDVSLEKRLSWAKHELEIAHLYDYQIVNEDMDITYQVLRSILIAEEHHIHKEKRK